MPYILRTRSRCFCKVNDPTTGEPSWGTWGSRLLNPLRGTRKVPHLQCLYWKAHTSLTNGASPLRFWWVDWKIMWVRQHKKYNFLRNLKSFQSGSLIFLCVILSPNGGDYLFYPWRGPVINDNDLSKGNIDHLSDRKVSSVSPSDLDSTWLLKSQLGVHLVPRAQLHWSINPTIQ